MANKIKIAFFNFFQKRLSAVGYQLIRQEKYELPPNQPLPEDSKSYLTPENPRLKQLVSNYLKVKTELTNSKTWNWATQPADPVLLKYFRGDTMYVWQSRGLDSLAMRYTISTYFVKSHDKMNLLESLQDDALFGNNLFQIAGRTISRELLDSVNEINFLERHLGLSKIQELKILDIGSGYGRMAHRLTQSLSNIKQYFCTDAVPHSLFICEFYLRFRGVKNASVIEMPSIETVLPGTGIHLAMNIHSFSECTLEAIEWWISQIEKANIKYLFVVPNPGPSGDSKLLTNEREDFGKIIQEHGYSLIANEPKFSDPAVQRTGLYPSTYYLFEKTK